MIKLPTYGAIVILAILALMVTVAPAILSFDQTNVSTTVNITQNIPEILLITINNGSNIDLTQGTTTLVKCNVTAVDYNGYNEINFTNATFYDYAQSSSAGPPDRNDYYINNSCNRVSNIGPTIGIWECSFDVYYYANNGTWTCDAYINDSYGFNDTAQGNGTINALYALNVTDSIDYGDMAVGDVSSGSEVTNITNFGNMDINISVLGYGGNNSVTGAGLAFICAVGNISISNERYSLTDQAWNTMNQLSGTSTHIPSLTLPQQVNDSQYVLNQTYWRLYVPPNPFGVCNGTVVFEAELP